MNEPDVLAMVVEEIARRKALTPDAVNPDAEVIRDLGLDSLDYAGVVVGTEAAIGGELDEGAVDWAGVRTVRDLAAALHKHVKR